MRMITDFMKIAIMSLWLCGLAVNADAFLYDLRFDQNIGTRTFGRLAGGQDGFEDMTNGDSPLLKATPDTLDTYDCVYFQGSGMFEAGTDVLQLYQWLQLGRDVKNSDSFASTWVLVIDGRFFVDTGLSQLNMSWTLNESSTSPAGTLQLVKSDGSIAVNDMKSGTTSVVFARTPSGSQLGPGRYEIRYGKAEVTVPAPATPEPIRAEMPWVVNASSNVAVCPIELGKWVQLIPGHVRVFQGGQASAVAPGAAEAKESGGQWQISYTLPDQIDGFDQVVIGYRITTATGSADSLVTIVKSGKSQPFPYPTIVQGWNLLAVPPLLLLPEDPGIDALLTLRPLVMDRMLRAYAVLAESAQMTQCRAFWVFNASSSSPQITVNGQDSGAVCPDMQSGWNFTGVADNTKSVADLNVSSAWRWNGKHYVMLLQEVKLQPGVGYWLYRE